MFIKLFLDAAGVAGGSAPQELPKLFEMMSNLEDLRVTGAPHRLMSWAHGWLGSDGCTMLYP